MTNSQNKKVINKFNSHKTKLKDAYLLRFLPSRVCQW